MMRTIRRVSFLVGAIFVLTTGLAFAHCDGLDGPVVQAAREALAAKNVNLVLIWVKKEDEPEIKSAFEQTLAVRKRGDEARQLADRNFFETLVRVHRAGEGAGFKGLKPAGRDLGPAIPAADKALRDGNPEALIKLLTATLQDRVNEHFDEALRKKSYATEDVDAGREFVKAYVEYIHCVEALYEIVTHPMDGHYDDAPNPKSDNEIAHSNVSK